MSAWLQPDGNLLLAPDENDISTSFFSSSASRSSFGEEFPKCAEDCFFYEVSVTVGAIRLFFCRWREVLVS